MFCRDTSFWVNLIDFRIYHCHVGRTFFWTFPHQPHVSASYWGPHPQAIGLWLPLASFQFGRQHVSTVFALLRKWIAFWFPRTHSALNLSKQSHCGLIDERQSNFHHQEQWPGNNHKIDSPLMAGRTSATPRTLSDKLQWCSHLCRWTGQPHPVHATNRATERTLSDPLED